MSRYIDADALEPIILWQDYEGYVTAYSDAEIENAPSIDLADYVPKEFHDRTCEAMAKRHQEEIADMVSVVRCKECKHCECADKKVHLWCDRQERYMIADDYCSYGERRE